MNRKAKGLIDALALGAREHIALVGGGGKTTLMFALTDELKRKGKRVLASTTTKVWHREALEYEKVLLIEDDGDWKNKKAEGLSIERSAFVGKSILDTGKVEGISATLADEIFHDSNVDYLVVEADGSAGRPLKAPAEHEPVVPGSVTMVVAMMGLEAMSARLDEATVFRLEQVRSITGIETGGILTPSALAKVFLHPAGLFKGAPEGARRVVFLNKEDLVEEDTKAVELADILLADSMKKIDRVILGSIKKGEYETRAK